MQDQKRDTCKGCAKFTLNVNDAGDSVDYRITRASKGYSRKEMGEALFAIALEMLADTEEGINPSALRLAT